MKLSELKLLTTGIRLTAAQGSISTKELLLQLVLELGFCADVSVKVVQDSMPNACCQLHLWGNACVKFRASCS